MTVISLSIGPTSFAPVIDAAVGIVERSNGQYHVLVIIADGQVTRNSDTPHGKFSPQEKATINFIIAASENPTSYQHKRPLPSSCSRISMLLTESVSYQTCKECGVTLSSCPMCRQEITTRLRLYT
ncbi:E3 ubiquitin-protein ligase RGLG2 [Glycine soja]|nr:E3 ubiquitin-protein ligase RGLG2 [Glycine soja]